MKLHNNIRKFNVTFKAAIKADFWFDADSGRSLSWNK